MNRRSRTDIQRKALAAAASVVLAFGCGGSVSVDSKDDTDSSASPAPIADEDVVVDTDLLPETDLPLDSDGGDTDLPVDTDPPVDTDAPASAPDCTSPTGDISFECCEELRVWCDETWGLESEAATECLFGPNFDGSTGCIPWGPPVPPTMA